MRWDEKKEVLVAENKVRIERERELFNFHLIVVSFLLPFILLSQSVSSRVELVFIIIFIILEIRNFKMMKAQLVFNYNNMDIK